MSGELDIRGGGVVAVDTATLGAAAAGFLRLGHELEEIRMLVGQASMQLFDASRLAWPTSSLIEERLGRGIRSSMDGAGEISADLREAQAVYELVELRAERAAASAAGDQSRAAALDRRMTALEHEYPDAHLGTLREQLDRGLTWPNDLAGQGLVVGVDPLASSPTIIAVWLAGQALAGVGLATIPRQARLEGPVAAVRVAPVGAPARPAVAPANLADTTTRIPGGADGSRVRVERYTMADGTKQFAVYVTGTKSGGGREPFDTNSNLQLYTGHRSASFDATMAALRQSGAQHGDVVHAFGHSQGAMVTARLALEGGFDTRTLVSIGSPVEADVGESTLSISLRHTDDPVAALAAGGHADAVGAPGSFIAERSADPTSGIDADGHSLGVYGETARMLDESTDPRMTRVRELFAELGGAASVDVTEYSAVRE